MATRDHDLRSIGPLAVDDGWATMSTLGNYLTNLNASFDPRRYGSAKLSTLVKAQDYLEVKGGSGTTPMRVRLKPAVRKTAKKASAKKAAAQPS